MTYTRSVYDYREARRGSRQAPPWGFWRRVKDLHPLISSAAVTCGFVEMFPFCSAIVERLFLVVANAMSASSQRILLPHQETDPDRSIPGSCLSGQLAAKQ